MCGISTTHGFYANLSRKKYNAYVKESKIIKIFNDYGIDGLKNSISKEELLNEKAKLAFNLRIGSIVPFDLWINAAALICIYHENLDLVRYLLKLIATVADNQQQQRHQQMTYEGWQFEHCPLLHLLCCTDIVDDRLDIYLCERNDINVLDSFGRNCLFYVRIPEIYNFLVSRGADKRIRDCFGYSPIFYMFTSGYESLALNLLDSGDRDHVEKKQIAKFIVEDAKSDQHFWMHILENIALPTSPDFKDAFLFMAIETRYQGCSKVYRKLAGIYERDDATLFEVYDSFLIRKRSHTDVYRLMFVMSSFRCRILCPLGPVGYKKIMKTLFQYPADIPKIPILSSILMDYVGEFCDRTDDDFMDYMREVMNTLDRWTFNYKHSFAMCWVYNCWLRDRDVVTYLRRLLTDSTTDVVFDFVQYQAHNHLQVVDVEFIRLCLDNGLSANARREDCSLLDFCQRILCITENKRQLCKLLLEYGAQPNNNNDDDNDNNNDIDNCCYPKICKPFGS